MFGTPTSVHVDTMDLQQFVGSYFGWLHEPARWERDEGFRSVTRHLVRRGLLAAGTLALIGVLVYLFVNLVLLGKELLWWYPDVSTKAHVVVWDKLLIAIVALTFVLASRRRFGARWGRHLGFLVVVALSFLSVLDDVSGGDVAFAPVYPTLYLLVALGTLPYRPLQTLAMALVVTGLLFFGEAVLPGVLGKETQGVVREQIPFMFIVTVLATGISGLICKTRYEQYVARVRAERLEENVAAYAARLEEHARALQIEKEKSEEHARKVVELERLKDRFFANISHEFRTPLTLILGPVQDALREEYGPVNAALRRRLSLVKQSANRLLGLVSDLLDLSKLEAGEARLRPVEGDLVPVVRTIVHAFTDLAARKGIDLKFDSETDSLRASFDRNAIEKVLYNLLSNAMKFTPPNGNIRVRISNSDCANGANFCLSVRDTGPGIPADDLAKVFDRFHQVDRGQGAVGGGTGLGLALVKELVELHGGDVSVQSEPGFGSEFVVSIPIRHQIGSAVPRELITTLPEMEPGSDEDEGDEAAPVDAPVVLIVDNDEFMREYVRSSLTPMYRITEASDGEEALDRVREEPPALVVCDVMMPGIDGFEFCRTVKNDSDLAQIPVVLLTARADEESRLDGLKAGADDYVTKPFSSLELIARVENLIELRRLLYLRYAAGAVEPTPVEVASMEDSFVERVRAVVEERMEDTNFGVDWLADEVGLSARQLQRRLRRITRLSAAGYIRLMRLKRAAQLLNQRAGNVSEVAYKVGFRDSAHFSKLFKQTFGVLPSELLAESESVQAEG